MPGASLLPSSRRPALERIFSGTVSVSAVLLLLPVGTALADPVVPSTPFSSSTGLQNRPSRARDSFLYPPANSTAELVRAIENDRALRLRYARHFHVSEDQFLNFAHRALITYRLPAARMVTTYGVTRTGVIYPVRERLPKGTLVWATHSGVPVLKWRCANPLTDRLPGSALPGGPRLSRASSPAKPVPPPELVASVPSNELPPAEEVPGLIVPPAYFAPLPLSGGGQAGVPVIASSPRGGSGWIFPIPLLIGALLPHGGGGGGETPPPFIPPPSGGGETPGGGGGGTTGGGGGGDTTGGGTTGGGGTGGGGGGGTGGGMTGGGGGGGGGEIPVVPEPGPIAIFSIAAIAIGGLTIRQRRRRVKTDTWNVEAGS